MKGLRTVLAAVVAFGVLSACASPASEPTSPAAAERKRVNAEKQEALQQMLEKGQRD